MTPKLFSDDEVLVIALVIVGAVAALIYNLTVGGEVVAMTSELHYCLHPKFRPVDRESKTKSLWECTVCGHKSTVSVRPSPWFRSNEESVLLEE